MRFLLPAFANRRRSLSRGGWWRGVSLCLLAGATTCAAVVPPPLVTEPSFFVRSWTVNDGTPVNSVMGAVRREDGYLWVATRSGLFRFDGEKFQSVQQLSYAAMPGVVTPAMCQDRRGRLWLTKDCGVVACVNGSTIRLYTLADGLSSSKPDTLAEDGDGALWISYYDKPLCRIKDGQVQSFALPAGLSDGPRTLLAGDSKGQVWLARGRQLAVLRAGRVVPVLTQPQPVTCLAAARQGGVWLSDGRQIWSCREGGAVEWLGAVPAGVVDVIQEDQYGRLWVAVHMDPSNAGLFYHDGRAFRSVPVKCPYIISLSDDGEGNLWVGSRSVGLIQVRPRTVELVTPVADVPGGVVSFCEDTGGRRYAVGGDGLLVRMQEGGWAPMTTQPGWAGGRVTSVAANPRGGVWLGIKGDAANEHLGLQQWQDGRFSGLDAISAQLRSPINALMEDSKGNLWMGMQDFEELNRLRDGQLRTFAFEPNKKVSAMAEDTAGNVWIALWDGRLMRAEGDAMLDLTPKVNDPPEPIRCLHATPDGSLWIGYETRGLGRLKGGRFDLFGPAQGFVGDAVSQILTDERGWLWGGGDRGIFRVRVAELEALAAGQLATLHPVLCGRGEGMPVLQATLGVAARSRSGELCMAMGNGLAVIDPASVLRDPPPPAVLIDRLSVNGRPLAAYESGTVAERGHDAPPVDLRDLTDRLSLGCGVRQLGIEYTVVEFSGQENVRFRYRLQGLDDTWVDAGPQRVAYFSQLPPGRYRFQVSACNNVGIWNEAGTALDLKVLPRFWQTWWFRTLAILLGLAATIASVRFVVRRRLHRKLEPLRQREAVQRERARIARDIHDDLGARLTTISLLSSLTTRDLADPQRTAANLTSVSDAVREVTRSLDEVVWAVEPGNDTLDQLATYLCHYAEEFLQETGVRCRLHVPAILPAVDLSSAFRHDVFLAVKEALNNVVKHAAASTASFSLAAADGRLTLTIEDDGRGFDVAATAQGNGLGNMQRRLEDLGGRFHLESRSGAGTRIRMVLPLP